MEKQSKLIKTPFDELTYAIIGCAMASHSQLGPGHRENIYQRDLGNRLAERQIPYEAQRLFEVFGGTGRDAPIGYYIPDFVVDEQVVVEIKALPGLGSEHTAQVIGYLTVSRETPRRGVSTLASAAFDITASCPRSRSRSTRSTTSGCLLRTG